MKDLTNNTKLFRTGGIDVGRLRLARESTEIVQAERQKLSARLGRPVSISIVVDYIVMEYQRLKKK